MKLTNYHFLSFALPATLVAQVVEASAQQACANPVESEVTMVGETEGSNCSLKQKTDYSEA